MIIRSQDKKELHILDTIKMIRVVSNFPEFLIEVNSQHVIGTYSTEEKAIKVLDMIQDKYLNCNRESMAGCFGFVKNTVFQMPADNEVEV